MIRRAATAIVVVVIAVAGSAFLAQKADAAPSQHCVFGVVCTTKGSPIPIPSLPSKPAVTCTPTPPPVRSSATGISAQLDGKPVDPTGPGVYNQYGVHALSWAVYDPGCAGDVEQPWAVIDTHLSDLMLGCATDLVAAVDFLRGFAVHPTWLDTFDPLLTGLTRTMLNKVFYLLLWVSLTVIGLLIIWQSRKGHLPNAVTVAAWAFLVMGVATAVADAPVWLEHQAEHFEAWGANSIAGSIDGNSGPSATGSLLVDQVLEPPWLAGEVGSDTSATALKYGAALLDGQAYKWSQLDNGTPASSKVTAQKQSEFASAAAAIKTSDPAAYADLQGQGDGRIGDGIWALAGTLAVVPVVLLSYLAIILALLLLTVMIVLSPAIFVIGMHHQYRAVVTKGVFGLVGAALVNAFALSVVAAVWVLYVGYVLDPAHGLPIVGGLVIVGVSTAALLYSAKHFRLTRMLSPAEFSAHMEHVGRAASRQATFAREVAAAAVGGAAGYAVEKVKQRHGEREQVPDQGPTDLPDVDGWVSSVPGTSGPDVTQGGSGEDNGEAAPFPPPGSLLPPEQGAFDNLPEAGEPESEVTPETWEDPLSPEPLGWDEEVSA